MSKKEEKVENVIKRNEQDISPPVDEKVEKEIGDDEENVKVPLLLEGKVPLIKKDKIKKINDEEFNKRVKEIINAGQEFDSDLEESSDTDTYSYGSSCSTCRSDSTHYHLQ